MGDLEWQTSSSVRRSHYWGWVASWRMTVTVMSSSQHPSWVTLQTQANMDVHRSGEGGHACNVHHLLQHGSE